MSWRSVLEKRWSLSIPQPRFHVDSVRKVYSVSRLNVYILIQLMSYLSQQKNFTGLDGEFDQDFVSRSLLGLPANSIEELFITTENFTELDMRILIKIFHVEAVRKVYSQC